MGSQRNSYVFTKAFFEFVANNLDQITPLHLAVMFYIIELNNKCNWSEVFSLPTKETMRMTRIRSYNTYKKVLADLVRWEFIRIIEKAKNQFESKRIALSFGDIAKDDINESALSRNDIANPPALSGNNTANPSALSFGDTIINSKKKPINKTSVLFSPDFSPANSYESISFKLWNQCYEYKQALSINPTTLKKAKPKAWAKDIELMITKDCRTEQEINEVIEWLKTDDFWQPNIQSASTLREKFEKLQLKMRAKPKRNSLQSADLSKSNYDLQA